MKWKRKRKLVLSSLRQSLSDRKVQTLEDRKRRAYYHSTRLCGYRFDPNRPNLIHRCRKATCSSCSKEWAKKIASKFIEGCTGADENKFTMITLGFDLRSSPESCFELFADVRSKIQRSIYKSRDPKRDMVLVQQWRDFSMAGSLEIDHFRKAAFHQLGSDKKASYMNDLNFNPETWVGEDVYFPHYHGVVYLGDLPLAKLEEKLRNWCRVVHVQPLWSDQTTDEAINNVLGYASKTFFETTLDGNRKVEWDSPTIDDYVDSLTSKRGRQAYKLCIKKYKRR